MANRSYLYAFDRFEDKLPFKPRGVTYWSSQVPVAQRLLASSKPRAYASSVEEGKIAIVGDFAGGVARLRALLRFLAEDAAMADRERFLEAVAATERFFEAPEHQGRFVLVEPFEIFWLEATAPEVQLERLLKQIDAMARATDVLVEAGADQARRKLPSWISRLRKEWSKDLGLENWTHILPVRLDG